MDSLVDLHFTEESRLKTFTTWPYDDGKKCNKRKMAEAGFYKTGDADEIDLAKCFLCGKQMDGWEEHDDPWEEHKSHAPYCLFAQIGKAEENLMLEELIKIMVELEKYSVKKKVEDRQTLVETTLENLDLFKLKMML